MQRGRRLRRRVGFVVLELAGRLMEPLPAWAVVAAVVAFIVLIAVLVLCGVMAGVS